MTLQHELPVWVVGLFILIFLFAALELGYRIGYNHREKFKDAESGGGQLVLTTILALLSLMLAFTYGAGVSRFDASKQAVLLEANIIRTVFLRADLIAEPESTEIKKALFLYARTRVINRDNLRSIEKFQKILQESLQAQSKLWLITKKIVEQSQSTTIVKSLLTNSVNQLMNVHTIRFAAFTDKLPAPVLVMLLLIAAASLSLAGFNAGVSGRISRWRMTTLTCVLTGVIFVINDFDDRSGGFILVNQGSISQVVKDIEMQLTL